MLLKLQLMRKFILTLVAFPLMACANNSNTIPEIAYRSQTETTTNTAPNFDIIDVKYNLKGLFLFSMLWFFYYVLARLTKINNEIS